jgi:long-subunit acyl-CoA synthetase (AMP-forming)
MPAKPVQAPAALGAATITQAFRLMVAADPDGVALRTRGEDAPAVTWRQWQDRSDAIAAGLAQSGVGKGDTVALIIANKPEFMVVDMAVLLAGATPFSVYHTAPAVQVEHQLRNSGARVAIVDHEHLEKMLDAGRNTALETVIVVDPPAGGPPERVLALDHVERSGELSGFDADAAAAQIEPDDLLTLIYTSGTTGPPKGVEITHANVMALLQSSYDVFVHAIGDGARVISWLPNAHVAERVAHYYAPIAYHWTVTCCPDAREIVTALSEVRPQWFFSVPRIWEKLKAGLDAAIAAMPDEQRRPTEAAIALGVEKVRLEQRGEELPEELAAQWTAADEQILARLRAQLGMDGLAIAHVGAAPTPVEVLEFFNAIGVPLAELWGMSETSGSTTVAPAGEGRIGTVGKVLPGMELRVAEDGELFVRGPFVMRGYHRDPARTAEVLGSDGWLATGDVGVVDDDGYVTLLDRKKELIINAAGKNMSPANIEATIKAASPLIGQACAIGDRRPYNTALIVLDPDFAPAWAKQQGIEGTFEDLAVDARVRAAVEAGISAGNEKLSRVEQIKRFTVIRGDWPPAGDELTPTMKLKRRPIAEKYAAEISAMYE